MKTLDSHTTTTLQYGEEGQCKKCTPHGDVHALSLDMAEPGSPHVKAGGGEHLTGQESQRARGEKGSETGKGVAQSMQCGNAVWGREGPRLTEGPC